MPSDLSIAQVPPSQMVARSSFPTYEASIGITVVIVMSATGFAFKWLFDQAVKSWMERFKKLEENLEKAVEESRELSVQKKQFEVLERRLENLGGALQDTQKLYQEGQREMLKLRSELTTDYVRREDWIRFSSTLEAKMDSLNRKIEDRMDNLFEKLSR